jgi:hypothetical protein
MRVSNRTYIGIVEDNNDPRRLGRCRIRVFDVFDGLPPQDIPWATPWKDLNGNQFILPEVGKVVTVVFDSENIYKPEYIYSDNYNINLENKLKKISDVAYSSMRTLLFDHKTQIYSNDDEGLMIDYKFNHVNMTDSTINISLKDNYGKVNIGDKTADQESILGTNFLAWFDEFVDSLLGHRSGPYFDSKGAPVVASPDFISLLRKYKAQKQPKFLSKNVFLNSNHQINTVRQNSDFRETLMQLGDSWKSTKVKNYIYSDDVPDYSPKYGTGEETPVSTNASNDIVSLSTSDEDQNVESIVELPTVGEVNPDVQKILNAMESKNYKIIDKPYYINVVAIRDQYEGDTYSNQFKDRMWAIWKNSEGLWEFNSWAISTIPGLYMNFKNKIKMKTWCKSNRPKGLGILVPAQYQNIYKFFEAEEPKNLTKMKARPTFRSINSQLAYRDKSFESDIISFSNRENPEKGNHGMFIHRGFPGGSLVNNWSEGCQVFSRESDYDQLCELARNHIKMHGNSFDYTLMTSKDIDSAS